MKTTWYRRVRFVGQSLLWSLLIYTAIVFLIDWEDFKRRLANEPYLVKTTIETSSNKNKQINTETIDAIKAIWLHLTRSHR